MTLPTHLLIGIDMFNAEGTPWDGLAFHLKGEEGGRKEEEKHFYPHNAKKNCDNLLQHQGKFSTTQLLIM